MIASALPVYADFDFFSLPERSPLAIKFGIASKDESFLKYPKSEISFLEKSAAARTLHLALIKDSERAIRFVPISMYYNTGLCVAFKLSCSLDSLSFAALGDLKSELCASPSVLRLLEKAQGTKTLCKANFFDHILNFNAFVSRGVDFDTITHDIAARCFSCINAVSNLCGCSFGIKREYPKIACVSNFDYGMFGLFALCAADAVIKNEFSKRAEFSVNYDEESGMSFNFRFFGSVGDVFSPLVRAADQRRMPLFIKSGGGETSFSFSPMRPEVSMLELKDDPLIVKTKSKKEISWYD